MKVQVKLRSNLFKKLMCFGLFVFAANTFAATQIDIETSQGNFTLELYPEKAPKTVANFVKYAEAGFYSNTIFHRVINRFMIQGGGFERDLTEKQTEAPIVNESNNGLLNEIGTIAMARTQDPNSATAQFFINVGDNVFLNYQSPDPELIGYCVFGKVTKGLDVIKQISLVPTTSVRGYSDVPIKPVVIKSVKVTPQVPAK